MPNAPLCEIRVPTYQRPILLRRALTSLLRQSFHNWIAIIYDDSSAREGKVIVDELNDPRIIYSPNDIQLGAANNLDRSFQTSALRGGAYACVLEDDNYLFPAFLHSNITLLNNTDARVLFRNQLVETIIHPHETGRLTSRTTLGAVYSDGQYSPLELLPSVFFAGGISNGSLFWRTDARTNFTIGKHVEDTIVQEYLRMFRIEDPVIFASEPLAAWRANGPESINKQGSSIHQLRRRIHRLRAVQQLRREAYRRLRDAGLLHLLADPRFTPNLAATEKGLLHSAIIPPSRVLPAGRRVLFYVKGCLLKWSIPCSTDIFTFQAQ